MRSKDQKKMQQRLLIVEHSNRAQICCICRLEALWARGRLPGVRCVVARRLEATSEEPRSSSRRSGPVQWIAWADLREMTRSSSEGIGGRWRLPLISCTVLCRRISIPATEIDRDKLEGFGGGEEEEGRRRWSKTRGYLEWGKGENGANSAEETS
nr:hypothetical protein CFP56_16933 [Quercus suber]